MAKFIINLIGLKFLLAFLLATPAAAEWKKLDILEAADDPLAIVDFGNCSFRLRLDQNNGSDQQRFFFPLGAQREKKADSSGEAQSLDFFINYSDMPLLIQAGVLDQESAESIDRDIRDSKQTLDLKIKVILGPSTWTHRINITYATLAEKGIRNHFKPLRPGKLKLEALCK